MMIVQMVNSLNERNYSYLMYRVKNLKIKTRPRNVFAKIT